jgi:voltage-dependent calcium channel T type alpha-1G
MNLHLLNPLTLFWGVQKITKIHAALFGTRHRPLSIYYKVQETEKDFICSMPKDNGMHLCSTLPPMKFEGRVCNESAVPGALSHLTDTFLYNGSCVNWNQYYTNCKAGEKNPFQGAISFDNIGLAWVAIFLVNKR